MKVPRRSTTATHSGIRKWISQINIVWVLVLVNLLVLQSKLRRNRVQNIAEPLMSPERTFIGYALAPSNEKAVALPSIRSDNNEEVDRTMLAGTKAKYGGEGDKKHLGGFVDIDLMGISPEVWKYMITSFGVKSVMDVGCGRGISTSWFYLHGVDALCVEGSHDAVTKTLLPNPETQIIEHDFSRGPWWPQQTYDAVWCVEFLEHVGRNFHANYFPAFRKSALIFATHSKWGGWHHVEVHDDNWWIAKFKMYGFIYSEQWTKVIREIAFNEKHKSTAPNGNLYAAQHVWLTMQVYINPAVAALPQHAHLMAGPGCFQTRKDNEIINRDCDKIQESKLPLTFLPLPLKAKQDQEWINLVKKNIAIVSEKKKK